MRTAMASQRLLCQTCQHGSVHIVRRAHRVRHGAPSARAKKALLNPQKYLIYTLFFLVYCFLYCLLYSVMPRHFAALCAILLCYFHCVL